MSLKPLVEKARALERAGRLDDALAAYREAAAADPAAAEPRIRIIGFLLLRQQLADAEREARAFLAQRRTAESLATLGQVLRLTGRIDEAIGAYHDALALDPASLPMRSLLNDARRSKYWTPNGDEWAALDGLENPTYEQQHRLMHLRLLGILSPDVQAWLTAISPESEALPVALSRALDAKFAGRFSQELGEISSLAESLRREGPYAPRNARIVTTSGTLEGTLIDSDALILGALEAIDGSSYTLIPFGEIERIDIAHRATYFTARLRRSGGRESTIEVPALYYYTEWCRDPQARDGRVTVWKALTPRFRIALGLRDFVLGGAKPRFIGIGTIESIQFST